MLVENIRIFGVNWDTMLASTSSIGTNRAQEDVDEHAEMVALMAVATPRARHRTAARA